MTKICLLAGNYDEAKTWASGQNLEDGTWFYSIDIDELKHHVNFHVLVIGTAGQNVPASYFDRIYQYAKQRGKIFRE